MHDPFRPRIGDGLLLPEILPTGDARSRRPPTLALKLVQATKVCKLTRKVRLPKSTVSTRPADSTSGDDSSSGQGTHLTAQPPILVGNVPFTVSDLQNATDRVIAYGQAEEATTVRLANAYCVALANENRAYGQLLATSGVNFPDGTPVAWVMRLRRKGTPVPRQVRGPSLFESVLNQGRAADLRHFLLGTSPQTLALLRNRIDAKFPGTNIVGTLSPPFGPLNPDFYHGCLPEIAATDPDIVWVALGTPKQDFAAHEIAQLSGRTTVAVGAAFDFLAGTVKQAPSWTHGTGLEWIFRLAAEPSRLWRRYLIGNAKFIRIVALQFLTQRPEFRDE
ncbi:WecB/TagA/CpsF family glycosyltransferase [Rhodococcoides fascians]|uniref:WecB/TagA/CpsF family glycosyltransferase n=1 Tax=Rhodococcoides fascians TaxID=1828 RepID=UPI0009B901A6|nr:WecB/TagA/CpsF family glycosyltransferase [Rhodococcus fascians]